jgi:elongation factor G
MTPVFLGPAYKKQSCSASLLNAVINYLPSPLDIENEAIDLDNNEGK